MKKPYNHDSEDFLNAIQITSEDISSCYSFLLNDVIFNDTFDSVSKEIEVVEDFILEDSPDKLRAMLFIYHTYFSKFLNVRQSISNLVKLGMDDISLEDHALNIIENNDENIKDQKH